MEDSTVYLGDLSPLASTAEIERILDRRTFAMPYSSTTIDGEDFDHLDPADPDERGLLIKGEHPEYHDALADPSFDGEMDGHSPRLHLTMHEIIANQLWDNDPPEVWQAAQRLRDNGMDRHDILHELLGVMIEHMHPVLTNKVPFDGDAYRRDLDGLGAARRSQRGPTTCQIKVSIAGSDPEIWRRLSLPGDTPLSTLHDIIQVAFDWEDAHPHEFEAEGRRYADTSLGDSVGALEESRTTLAEVAPRVSSRLRYTYDFGNDWVHDIVVEAIDGAQDEPRVTCLAGERAGPPEDDGDMQEDPAAFSQRALNAALTRISLD